MKQKYNCNNTLEFIHEIERMCKAFTLCKDCPLDDIECRKADITAEHIKRVQIWSDAHPEITLTDKQVEIFKALNLLGFRYIAKDADGKVYAFTECPRKGLEMWGESGGYFDLNLKSKYIRAGVFDAISSLVSWSDTEPLNIAEVLEQAEAKRSDSNV